MYLSIMFYHWIFWFSGGQTIIFTERKESASELSSILPGARPLHGDIQQSQREVRFLGTLRFTLSWGSTSSCQLKIHLQLQFILAC